MILVLSAHKYSHFSNMHAKPLSGARALNFSQCLPVIFVSLVLNEAPTIVGH